MHFFAMYYLPCVSWQSSLEVSKEESLQVEMLFGERRSNKARVLKPTNHISLGHTYFSLAEEVI